MPGKVHAFLLVVILGFEARAGNRVFDEIDWLIFIRMFFQDVGDTEFWADAGII